MPLRSTRFGEKMNESFSRGRAEPRERALARARAPPFTGKLCAAAETSRPSIFNPPTDDRKKARRARHIVSERRRFKIPPCLFLPRGPSRSPFRKSVLSLANDHRFFLSAHFNQRAFIIITALTSTLFPMEVHSPPAVICLRLVFRTFVARLTKLGSRD